MRKIRHKSQEKGGSLIAPMMNVTESEFDNRIQKVVDDDDVATDEEVSQFYERWLCEK